MLVLVLVSLALPCRVNGRVAGSRCRLARPEWLLRLAFPGNPKRRAGYLQTVIKEITQRVMSDVPPVGRPDRRSCGRPSKGDRVSLLIRVPRSLAALFAEDASQAGVSQSDRMTEILSSLYAGHGPVPRPAEPGSGATAATGFLRTARHD